MEHLLIGRQPLPPYGPWKKIFQKEQPVMGKWVSSQVRAFILNFTTLQLKHKTIPGS